MEETKDQEEVEKERNESLRKFRQNFSYSNSIIAKRNKYLKRLQDFFSVTNLSMEMQAGNSGI